MTNINKYKIIIHLKLNILNMFIRYYMERGNKINSLTLFEGDSRYCTVSRSPLRPLLQHIDATI
jgi:hypothetical protein